MGIAHALLSIGTIITGLLIGTLPIQQNSLYKGTNIGVGIGGVSLIGVGFYILMTGF